MSKPIIASIAFINEVLKMHETHAKKRFGQNFIIDLNIINKIVNSSGVDKETLVIEIGPGVGSLTQVLLERALHVLAIEIDPFMVTLCQKHFEGEPNFTIIHDDVLDVNFQSVLKLVQSNYNKCMVVANLPYYITTPILFKLIESEVVFDALHLMVQKEVAHRFSAKVGTKDYNALSIIVQTLFEVKIALDVSRHVFIPKPNVDSCVVRLERKEVHYQQLRPYFDFLKVAFMQRRKTLFNNLKVQFDINDIKSGLIQCGLNESIRAEACTHDQLLMLYQVLSNVEREPK